MEEKRRPICNVDGCSNLGCYRGKDINGRPRYRSVCDTHRRKGHDSKALRNPNSIHYVPLDKCLMCNNEAVDRHRIIPRSEYITGNAVALCRPCHQGLHKLYNEMKTRGYTITPPIDSPPLI